MMAAAMPDAASPDIRDRAHALRNLFGAIASARHMLDDHPDEARRVLLLDAIEDAALRGGEMTTSMLAAGPDASRQQFDPSARLRRLEPLLDSVAGAGNALAIETDGTAVTVRGSPDRFDHIALELVANARNALVGGGTIHVRLRARHGKIILIVADTGRGMTAAQCRALMAAAPSEGEHGTGFQQVRRFAREIHGRLAIRSVPRRGTVVRLEMPAFLGSDPG